MARRTLIRHASASLLAVALFLFFYTMARSTACPGFGLAIGSSAIDFPLGITPGDFNEDGITDLVSQSGLVSFRVQPGLGAGGVGDGGFALGTLYPGTTTMEMVVGDFNDDGILDLAAAVPTGAMVRLGTGAGGVGDGGFGGEVIYPAGPQPRRIARGDFNEDGILDLVVGSSMSPYTLSVLLGNGSGGIGDGTFGAPTPFSIVGVPGRISVGDFDENGIADLALLIGGNGVSVLLGTGVSGKGNGGFGAATTSIVGFTSGGLSLGDFNDDQITDLVFAEAAGLVSVMLGQGIAGIGNGLFSLPSKYPAGTQASDVAVGDLNGDGIADLAVTMTDRDSVAILIGGGSGGIGDGTFAFDHRLRTHAGPRPIWIGDFLEDGLPDLAIANTDAATIQVFPSVCADTGFIDITVTDANGGESWQVGTNVLVRWFAEPGIVAVNVEISRDDGKNWEPIAERVIETELLWTVTGPPTCCARIRVYDPTVATRSDASDGTFEIEPDVVAVEGETSRRGRLDPPEPNPSAGVVSFALSAPREVVGRVEVLDVSGRLVRRLVSGGIPAGTRVLAWDGRDGEGRVAPPGVYFVRASWPGFQESRRIVRAE